MPALDDFFNRLWSQYTDITPQALIIHELLLQHEQNLVNDHVAFRTFGDSAYSIKQLERELFALGFSVFDEYHFEKKKLYDGNDIDNLNYFLSNPEKWMAKYA